MSTGWMVCRNICIGVFASFDISVIFGFIFIMTKSMVLNLNYYSFLDDKKQQGHNNSTVLHSVSCFKKTIYGHWTNKWIKHETAESDEETKGAKVDHCKAIASQLFSCPMHYELTGVPRWYMYGYRPVVKMLTIVLGIDCVRGMTAPGVSACLSEGHLHRDQPWIMPIL